MPTLVSSIRNARMAISHNGDWRMEARRGTTIPGRQAYPRPGPIDAVRADKGIAIGMIEIIGILLSDSCNHGCHHRDEAPGNNPHVIPP